MSPVPVVLFYTLSLGYYSSSLKLYVNSLYVPTVINKSNALTKREKSPVSVAVISSSNQFIQTGFKLK